MNLVTYGTLAHRHPLLDFCNKSTWPNCDTTQLTTLRRYYGTLNHVETYILSQLETVHEEEIGISYSYNDSFTPDEETIDALATNCLHAINDELAGEIPLAWVASLISTIVLSGRDYLPFEPSSIILY